MILHERVEKLITEYLDLIDAENWEELYFQLLEYGAMEKADVGGFTDALIEAGINPLIGKTHVENYMFFASEQSVITLPPTIQTIGFEAFAKAMDLSDIYIPKTVWEIGQYAFKDAGKHSNGLTIHFEGTQVDWQDIDKKFGWDKFCEITIEYLGDKK